MSRLKPMTLAELARAVPGAEISGDGAVAVTGVSYDSRKVEAGDLFVAVPGVNDDGARYIPQALSAGAVALLKRTNNGAQPAPVIHAPDVRLAMGLIAARINRRPDLDLGVAGVTGTNGKTTVTYLLESILKAAGERPGVIGTVNYRFGEKTWPAPTTTPESVDIMEILAEIKTMGATHAVMEISSHALDQKRVAGLSISAAAFTNLSRDHLDYHADFEDYYQAKKKLFTEVIAGEWKEGPKAGAPCAAVNLDDEYGRRLFKELGGADVDLIGYGVSADGARISARDAGFSERGIKARLVTPAGEASVSSRLIGAHNLENILAAAALAMGMGVELDAVAKGIENLASTPGRLEPVENDKGVAALVDYAHTPDALEHAVTTCAELKRGRLITVFGCGGDRDPGKRPLMGAIAVAGSDLAVVTSDNPRTEDPIAIIEQILEGARSTDKKELNHDKALNGEHGFVVEPDRARAIELAVSLARPGDVVLIAGKGHEDYQILGTEKIHFDDREQVAGALEKK